MFVIKCLSFGVEFEVEGIKIRDFGCKIVKTRKSSTRTGELSLRARSRRSERETFWRNLARSKNLA